MKRIKIFDTTLRDGEQAPGCTMNLREKLKVAQMLEHMRVDVIEAGFPVASPGDFEAVEAISKSVRGCTVAALARAREKDIDAAYEAIRGAADPRIHLFLATSPVHMQYKLHMTEDEVVARTAAMVKRAKGYVSNVEFSCEDATRSDLDFLCRVVRTAIQSGATVINLPDTVGYATPDEVRSMLSQVMARVPGSDRVEFSVHCHNDLGMAVANSLAGILGGARQVECTINGLGERAGNASLEEVVMAMRTRPDIYGPDAVHLDTTQITRASRTVYAIIGMLPPLNKPIVGRNAFLHESGIHQHGVMANKQTYEILTPEAVGVHSDSLVLGKHSGRHAFENRLEELGYDLTPDELDHCFAEFKDLCDKKKAISDVDLEALVTHSSVSMDEEDGYKLDWYAVHNTNYTTATASVCLTYNGEKFQAVSMGDGPIDAAFSAIDQIMKPGDHTFELYRINGVSPGMDTLGEVHVKLIAGDHSFSGRGLSTDIIEGSILAYISAVNHLKAYHRRQREREARS